MLGLALHSGALSSYPPSPRCAWPSYTLETRRRGCCRWGCAAQASAYTYTRSWTSPVSWTVVLESAAMAAASPGGSSEESFSQRFSQTAPWANTITMRARVCVCVRGALYLTALVPLLSCAWTSPDVALTAIARSFPSCSCSNSARRDALNDAMHDDALKVF